MNETASYTSKQPFYWTLGAICFMFLFWLFFHLVGEQRYYNTSWWQSWRPIVLKSEPQTAKPVEVRDQWRNALTVVQTEKGLYFLSGTKYVPAAGTSVTIQANDHWELYMCAADGRCMTIHSFCAGVTWPNVKRDEKGRAEGCYAPYYGKRSAEDLNKPPPPPDKPRAGPGKRFARAQEAAGMSHPSEWAELMGLPATQGQAPAAAGK